MDAILNRLNDEVGVKGSMIVTQDGIVVQAILGEDFDEDVVAAMASNTILSIKRALRKASRTGFERFILTSSYGKMIFLDVERAFLVVVADKNINLEMTLIAVSAAAYKIKTIGR